MQKTAEWASGNDVLFEELGNNLPSLAGLLLETIYKKDKLIVKHIEAKSFGIQFIRYELLYITWLLLFSGVR